jgi:hypothetical protein
MGCLNLKILDYEFFFKILLQSVVCFVLSDSPASEFTVATIVCLF